MRTPKRPRTRTDDLPPIEHRTSLNVEELEARDLMSANPLANITGTLSGGVLHVEGTASADQIRIVEHLGQITVENISSGESVAIKSGDSSVLSVAVDSVHRVEVDALEGDDTIWIGDGVGFLTAPLQILGSEGTDYLHSSGATQAAGLDNGVKQLLQFNGNTYTVGVDGDVLLNGSKMSFGGYALSAASLSIGDAGLSVTGLANVPVFGMVQFTGVIDTNGEYALKTDMLEERDLLGGLAKLEAPVITITSDGAKLDTHAILATIGQADLEGILKFDGNYQLKGKGGVELGPLSYDAVDFTLGSEEVTFSLPVPSIGDISFRGAYNPDGQWFIQGTYPNPVPVGNFTLTNITVGIANDRFTLGADVDPIPGIDGIVDARFDGEMFFDGRFTLTGNAKVTVGPVSLGDAIIVISNDPAVTKLGDRTVQMTIEGHAGIPSGPSVKLHGVIDSKGNYDLSGEETVKIAGLTLEKTQFTLKKEDGFRFTGDWNYGIFKATLSGEITSGGKVTFEGSASTVKVGGLDLGTVTLKGDAEKGLFSLTSTTKTFSFGGFSLTNSSVTITNRGTPNNAIVSQVTGNYKFLDGSDLTLTGTVATDGTYALEVTKDQTLFGLTLQQVRFTLKSGEGFRLHGNWNYFIYNGQVTGSIENNGRVTFTGTDDSGTYGGFPLGAINVEGTLDPTTRSYSVKFTTQKDLGVATVTFAGIAARTADGTWLTPTLTGRAAARGALGNILNAEADFTLTSGGVTFTGTVKYPYDAGSFGVKGIVRTDGSFEIQTLGLPGALPGLDAIPNLAGWVAGQVSSLVQTATAALQQKLSVIATQMTNGLSAVLTWKNDTIAAYAKQANTGLANALTWKNDTIAAYAKQANTGLANALTWKNDTITAYAKQANSAINSLYTWANSGINSAWNKMNANVTNCQNLIASWNTWLKGEYNRLDQWYNNAIGNLPSWARKLASYVNPIVGSYNQAINSAYSQTTQAIANLRATANSWNTWYNNEVNYFRGERDRVVASWTKWYQDRESSVLSEYNRNVQSWKTWFNDKTTWANGEYNRSVQSWQTWFNGKVTLVSSEYNKAVASWRDWNNAAQQSALQEIKNQLTPKHGATLEQQLTGKLNELSTIKQLMEYASSTVKAQLQAHLQKIADSLADVILSRVASQVKLPLSR